MDAISVKGLKKSYGDIKAVDGIDFSVKEGQLFAFLGPNGAGKSTTINILCTLLKPDEGEIRICGFDAEKEADSIREKIGVVFQESLLDEALTVRENLTARAGFYYKSKREIKEAVCEAAAAADAGDFLDRAYGKLSGGQRRRADIARALLSSPAILFLDEPTTGLDPQTRKNVRETIRHLQKENGMTVFLTTHYMEETADADEVLIIDGGKVAARGTPSELKEKYSSDTLRLYASGEAEMERSLNELGCVYEKHGREFIIRLNNSKDGISILKHTESCLETFEALHGSMDDVFVNITGKEIRE